MADAAPQHDAVVPCRPVTRMWALLQTSQTVEVLATGTDRTRLLAEAAALYGLDLGREAGHAPAFRLALRPTLLIA